MHPSDGTLRRSLDEPVALDPSSRGHIAGCPRCAARVQQISADASAVRSMLAAHDPVVDVAAGRSRLARSEALSAAGAAMERPVRPMRSRHGRAGRVLAGLAVAGVASTVLVVSGGAQDFLSLFSPSQLAAVPVSATDLRSLAGLANYGTVNGGSTISYQAEPDAAAAAAAAGFGAPVVGTLVTGTPLPKFAVVSGGVVAFTFDARLARAAAAKAGAQLPTMPAGLDGSTLSVSIAPAVVVSYGVDPATLLQGGGGMPNGEAFVVVKTRVPTVSSTGVTARQLEAYLLGVPGIPAGVASEIRAIGDPTQTIPVPIPIGVASGSSVTINGARGLLVGDLTGLGSAVIWQHNGVVYAVAGTLTSNQVLAIARSTH